MKSRVVNAIVGLMNLLFGSLVLFYSFYIPDLGRATEQEVNVAKEIYQYIFVLIFIVGVINIITLFFNRKDKILLFAYGVSLLSSCFYFFDIKLIAVLYILAALIVEIQVLRENIIVQSNTFYLILVSIVIVSIGIVGINIITYKDKVSSLTKIENKDNIEYDDDFFKYVSQLDDNDIYLNVERDGKWGYINLKGETKIDFKYDYASCFVKINKNGKDFDVALVCENNTASLILKNERVVFSYKNNIDIKDYEAQFNKLKDIYENVLGQEEKFDNVLKNPVTENINKIKSYEGNRYRYPFNEDYDIIITVSQTGTKNRYEFIKKDSDTIRVSIDCDDLAFDDSYLYLYSNGNLPFYKTSEKKQGWYTVNTKRTEINGNIQILDFYGDSILVKDYDEGKYYFINEKKDIISDKYLDIYVASNAYIVKNELGKYEIINTEFKEILDLDCDIVYTTFLEYGILVCGVLPDNVEFNELGYPKNINYKLINVNEGVIIGDGFSSLYNIFNKRTTSEDVYLNNLTDINFHFIGEKFYEEK